MTTNTSIPADVLQMIESKKEQLRAEQAAKAEAAKREQDELLAKGSDLYFEYRAQAIEKLPEGIRFYVRPARLSIDNYVRMGKGWDQLNKYRFTIDIPGLATIEYDANDMTYRTAIAEWNDSADDEPWFSDNGSWKKELDYVLCQAERQMLEHRENLVKWEAAKEEALHRYNQQEASDQETEARRAEMILARDARDAQEKAEELALFDAIKEDAVALNMLKAFVLLRDERSHFEQRLSDADETMYSMENRWSRRAAELRNQAEDAERRAQDEKSRLQSDLDDAEDKLKKAERAARGW
jgi:hypothetical protein